MNTTTTPLAVATADIECDTRHEHIVRVVTTGARVAAFGLDPMATNCISARRVDTEVVVDCDQPIPGTDGERCAGQVRLNLADPGAWRAAAPADFQVLDSAAVEYAL